MSRDGQGSSVSLKTWKRGASIPFVAIMSVTVPISSSRYPKYFMRLSAGAVLSPRRMCTAKLSLVGSKAHWRSSSYLQQASHSKESSALLSLFQVLLSTQARSRRFFVSKVWDGRLE